MRSDSDEVLVVGIVEGVLERGNCGARFFADGVERERGLQAHPFEFGCQDVYGPLLFVAGIEERLGRDDAPCKV
jgi:hypothetical protein